MATLIPVTQPTNVEAAYEDMFKEITRKLYGEETGNGLHTLGTPVAHVATSGPTAPEGERSFTTLMSDRSLAPTIEYEHNGATETSTANNFKSEDHLTTAFGLAALMQNGFPPSGSILNPQSLPKVSANITSTVSSSGTTTVNNSSAQNNTNSVNSTEQRWSGANEEIMPWASGGKLASFNGTQKPSKTSKNRDQSNELFQNSTGNNASSGQSSSSSSRKNKNNTANTHNSSNNNNQLQMQKRYSCSHCPYSTDRRDLYTRHENIHKDEKPFQCYACLKQFNRADHVKKHFLRMHRELAYDINKTRRSVNADQKPNIFVQNSNNNQQQSTQQQISDNYLNNQRSTAQDTSLSIAQTIESVATAQISAHSIQMKQEKPDDKSAVKIKREKRFSCCYCPWSGADKWGLKRHLNTHTKPFVCMLCDYKAARSERLATHVLKVHNKKACNKCSFLADNQEEYQAHMNEIHPHEQRPSRSNNNTNVLRTIGNTLVTNNQINNFQNPSTSFGTIQSSNSGVAIYTTNELTTNSSSNNNNGIQEIVVNPPSMVGWRLSTSGSLIPPHLHTSTGGNDQPSGNSGSANQKRGAERLFQYLEADGSDPEDYTRQLKMDAISRNTASVAQDFHNAGGVKFEVITCKPSTKPAAYLHKQENNNLTDRRNENNEIYDDLKCQRKAMSIFYKKQEKQLMKSPPAYLKTSKLNPSKGHRLNLTQDKENTNSIFSNMEYQNLTKLEVQFQNYVKEIISKYYAETPLLYPNAVLSPKPSETENYIEYLRSKGDITLTIAPRSENTNPITEMQIAATHEKRNRKQAQPKKIAQCEIIMARLRDKYLKKLVDRKKSCITCTNVVNNHMLFFPYHSPGSLAFHRLWKHFPRTNECHLCHQQFLRKYSLKVHLKTKHKL